MGIFDDILNVAGELFKDRPESITNWMDAMKGAGATRAHLERRGQSGIWQVSGAAFDSRGRCVDRKTWQIEANTGLKKFWEGDQSGLGELFDGGNQITYDLGGGDNANDDDDEDFDDFDDDDDDFDDFDDDD